MTRRKKKKKMKKKVMKKRRNDRYFSHRCVVSSVEIITSGPRPRSVFAMFITDHNITLLHDDTRAASFLGS